MKSKFDVMVAAGLGGVVVSFVFGVITSQGNFMSFISVPSLIIVVVGGLVATMISYSGKTFPYLIAGFQIVFQDRDYSKPGIVKQMVDISKIVRKSGFLAVEETLETLEDQYMKKGLQLVIDGMEPDVITEIMELEVDALAERHSKVIGAFGAYGEFLPAFGMIGTLIGLIIMLADLSDSAALGAGMSAALITTLYGALFANGLIIPIQKKLQDMSATELEVMDMVLKGVLDIQTGVSPRFLEEKLLSYCSPKDKEAYADLDAQPANDEE
jgi:chemotaxis protein MotA